MQRLLPEASDFSSKWIKTSPGVPDPHSGILPSLLTVDITHFLTGPGKYLCLGSTLRSTSGSHWCLQFVVHSFTHLPVSFIVNLSVDVGRPVHVDINLELFSELIDFSDGLLLSSVPLASPQAPQSSTQGSSGASVWLRSVSLVTNELSLQMATLSHPDSPKILTLLSGVKGNVCMTADDQGGR